ncbi:hypothetical protein Tco_0477524 [Tanacetum coccineum]
MELENSQNNALAKLPMLKTGEYECGDKDETGSSTDEDDLPSTAEEKTAKKNDVKAKSLLLMALPNEHQLTFNQYVDAQSMFVAIKALFGGNEATRKTQKALLKQTSEQFMRMIGRKWHLKWNMALLSMRARKFYQITGRKIIIDGRSTAGYDNQDKEIGIKVAHSKAVVRFEDALKGNVFIDVLDLIGVDMAEKKFKQTWLSLIPALSVTNDKSCSKSCLQNYEALKKQYDDLLVKLDDTGFKASTYKRDCQMGLLRTELEKVKEENEGFKFKIEKFEKSAKDLDQLLASQITDKSKGMSMDVGLSLRVGKKNVIPLATKKEFVKPEKQVRRSVSCPKHMVPRAVLIKTGLKPVNTIRSVNTDRPFSTTRSFNTVRPSYVAHPKSTIHCARPGTYFQNQAESTVYRPFYKKTSLTNRCLNKRFNTGSTNSISTVSSTVNSLREMGFNDVKPSAC